jgi:hypothetical protein
MKLPPRISWFRLSVDFHEHEKVIGLSDGAYRALIGLFTYCAQQRNDGRFGEQTLSKLVKLCHRRELFVSRLLERNEGETGMISIHGWLDWQESRADMEQRTEGFRDRQRRHRATAKEPDVTRDMPVTVTHNTHDQEVEVEVEREEDLRKTKPMVLQKEPVAVAPAKSEVGEGIEKAPKPSRAKPRTQCPPSGASEADMARFATQWGLESTHGEYPRFLDHHRKLGALMADWGAAWRNWLRNGEKWAKPTNGRAVQKSYGENWINPANVFDGKGQ